MRISKCWLAAAWIAVFTVPAIAQEPPSWTSEIRILRGDQEFADNPASIRWGGHFLGAWNAWIIPDDLPADLRGRALSTDSWVVLEIEPSGTPAACRILRPSSDARLDRLGCDMLLRRGAFQPAYVGPGQPVADRWVMGVRWETIDAATRAERARQRAAHPPSAMPQPLPGSQTWPRLNTSDNIEPTVMPEIQNDYPSNPGRPVEGVVSLDLVTSAREGITECRIGVGSGNPALDEAACRVARTIPLRYATLCRLCSGTTLVPLQVVWRRRGSHIRFPLPSPDTRNPSPALRHPSDTRTAQTRVTFRRPLGMSVSLEDYSRIPDRTMSNRRFYAELSVNSEGRVIGCEVRRSTGNSAIDARTCELLIARQRYSLRTDVFGDPAADIVPAPIDLSQLN